MSPPTYLARVQQALSDVVNEAKESIRYEDLVRRARSKLERGNGPRYLEYVRKAIKHEARARRIVVEGSVGLELVKVTASGKFFYAALDEFPLYRRDHPRLRYLTMRQLQQYTKTLRHVLDELKDNFSEFHRDRLDDDKLLVEIRELFGRVAALHTQNSELSLEVYVEESRKRNVTRALVDAFEDDIRTEYSSVTESGRELSVPLESAT